MNTENLMSVLPAEIAASTELTNAQKRVLGQLIVYSGLEEAKNNDGWFYRSNEDLCNDIEVSKPTLIEALRKLQTEDLIDRRVGSRAVGASEYRVKWVNLDTYPSKGKIGKVENFTNNDDVSTMILNELIKLNEAIGKIGKVIENLDLTQMDVLDAILLMGKISKVDKPTPDTDTDIKSLNYSRTELLENLSNRDDEISSNGGVPTPDNRKFEEQLSRIRRAVREVQTTDDQEYIETLQKVMDDACEKARLYATENQLTLINCRIEEFQKFASSEDSTAPEWVRELPGPYTYGEPGPSFEGYLQGVCQGLYDTEFSKRSRLAMICMCKWKKSFIEPAASFYQKDQEQVERGWEDLFNKRTAKYLTPEQPNSAQLPIQASAGETNMSAVV